jgi:23S rRNA (adenine2503-C2)-methyltransferase
MKTIMSNIDIEFKSPELTPTPNYQAGQKTNLIGLLKEELIAELEAIGEKSFRAKQIWNWIYAKGIKDFAQMSNIAKETQTKLAEKYFISRPEISKDLTSFDGTRKWLLKFQDGKEAEMVYIPEEDRGTLCISSQVGCTLTCKFCHTGTQLLVRNLAASEIVGQLMLARDLLGDWNNSKGDQNRQITSIVFMGMGEPLYNYDNVATSVKILNDADGINISRRRITVSTSGVVPELMRFSDEVRANLAISLHATNDETRSKIMPLNKKYPLAKLMEACEYYLEKNPNQRITFEYVMLKDVNDSDEDARNLAKLINKHKLTALVNLIPFNKWTGAIYECSSRNRIMAFSNIIKDYGLSAPIRKTRGDDVMAACGQLKSESEREKKKKS